jgi:hypothetical protein
LKEGEIISINIGNNKKNIKKSQFLNNNNINNNSGEAVTVNVNANNGASVGLPILPPPPSPLAINQQTIITNSATATAIISPSEGYGDFGDFVDSSTN